MNFFRLHPHLLTIGLCGLVLLCGTSSIAAVNFPGPILVDINDEVLSAVIMPTSGGAKQQAVLGTGGGFLRIVRNTSPETRFSLVGLYAVGGRVVSMAPWEGLPSGQLGLVVAAANPDRILFLEFTTSFPYFQLADSVDLEEDPGTIAFLGTPGEEMNEVAVSLPGVDEIVLIRKELSGWAISQYLPAGDQPHGLAALNLDADDELELVSANRGALSRSIGRYDFDSETGYALTRTLPLDITPNRIRVHDWDGNGIPDLVVAASDSSRIQAFDLTGSSALELGRLELSFVPDQLLVGALPGAMHGLFTSSSERAVVNFHQLVSGSAEPKGALYPGAESTGLFQCDFNGDGISDLLSLGGVAESVSVMYGKPDGTYWSYEAIALSGFPGSSNYSDFSGDGSPDLVVAGFGQAIVDLYPGLGGGGLQFSAESQDLAYFPGSANAIQLDADPESELAIYDVFSQSVRLMEWSAESGFVLVDQFPVGSTVSDLMVADLDHDGIDDILGYVRSTGSVPVFFGLGDGAFSARTEWSLGQPIFEALPMDLNNDDLLDLVLSDGVSRIWYALNEGGRALGQAEFVYAGSEASHLATGDLDGDGDDDLVVGNTGDGALSIMENRGLGDLVRRIGNIALSQQPNDLVCADLDQNGLADVVLNQRDSGTIGVISLLDQWQFSPVAQFPVYGNADRLLVEDFNNDEIPDLLILDGTGRVGYILPNLDLTFVAVDPSAIRVDCDDESLEIRIHPDRPGPWSLEYVGESGSRLLASSGFSEWGRLSYEWNEWSLTLPAGDLQKVGVERSGHLRLTVGQGGALETREIRLPDGCEAIRSSGRFSPLTWSQDPWPNPFNPVIRASVNLAQSGPLEASIYDLAGRRVRVLASGEYPAGDHTLIWRGETNDGPAPAGAYFLLIRSTEAQLSRKILLLK